MVWHSNSIGRVLALHPTIACIVTPVSGKGLRILAYIAPHSPQGLQNNPFSALAIELSVINLLPRAEVELAIGYWHNCLMMGASREGHLMTAEDAIQLISSISQPNIHDRSAYPGLRYDVSLPHARTPHAQCSLTLHE